MDSKFHCLGEPFHTNDYKEEDYTVRLYYSIKDKLPTGIEVNPSHRFGRRFTDLQYFYSTCKTEEVYFIRAVPDLIFRKKGTSSVVFVCNDTDLAEIKLGGHLPCSGGRPKAYAQISASLYFVATTKIIKLLELYEKGP